VCNAAAARDAGEFVLYWMIAFRRTRWNFALDRAVEWAVQLGKPIVIFEPLRIGYRWASDRMHRFVIDGMADNAKRIERLNDRGVRGVRYLAYVEQTADAGKGLLAELGRHACVIVTDDYPAFFLSRMVAAAASRLPVRVEQVDSNGLLPLRATDRVFTTAFSFRSFLQKELPRHLEQFPKPDALSRLKLPAMKAIPAGITRRWPAASARLLGGNAAELAKLPIDHSVPAVDDRGGSAAARRRLACFLDQHLAQYHDVANDPDADARSGLSPYLHFGHIASHELFHEVMSREGWSPERLPKRPTGKRQGWWGASAGAEAWLDEFITWRELGYNMTAHRDDYERYESLPDWSRATLEKHACDRRPFVYSLDAFAAARTHDELWNAAQTQLVLEGRIHNYLRMLWGKKILEWTATPRDALSVMIELNNRYAVDGRDPNSYSGIFWCLGRYDRPWGPDRPIFGTVRYMSSENTRRKLRVNKYVRQFAQYLATNTEGAPIRGDRSCSAAQQQHAADGAARRR
jgi:deoxyribodipyrimidine photo-lyase